MATTEIIKKFMAQLEEGGCVCKLDLEAGTATAKDGEVVVYNALQKGKGGAWIVRYENTENIKFN